MTPILFGLGTNIGDRAENLRRAVAALAELATITATSPVYETAPMYVTDQDAFLNMAATGLTALPPGPLLTAVKAIEAALGRTPSRRYGPRLIDVDILLYGDGVTDLAELAIPHPRMAERGFVLAPAADVAAQWLHPPTGRTIADLLAALGPLADVRRRPDIAIPAPPAAG